MPPKKVFILAGEASGDALGAWYIRRATLRGDVAVYDAIGGPLLAGAGAHLRDSYAELQVVGIAEIIRHLPRLLSKMSAITQLIVQGQYDEVVLVDFPGFNLRMLTRLKKLLPTCRITYLSPPQMWVWGAWRARKLARADRIIVLYPFEIAWYREHVGLTVEWWGSPVLEKIDEVVPQLPLVKEKMIALLPGSRPQEIAVLMRWFAPVIAQVCKQEPGITLAVILSPAVSREAIGHALTEYQVPQYVAGLRYVADEKEKYQVLASCCAALTKPGTNTLELALLEVPGVVLYKTSWLTYWLARMVINVSSMTLPNLLAGEQLYVECIQRDCRVERVATLLTQIVHEHGHDGAAYANRRSGLRRIRQLLTCSLRNNLFCSY